MDDKKENEFGIERSLWYDDSGSDPNAFVEPVEDKEEGDEGELVDRQNLEGISDEFIDFEVWVATLEAHFGPDFEQVLSNLMGPDWNITIQQRMMSGENFLDVINEIKNKHGYEEEEEDEKDGETVFRSEAVGEGEILGDSSAGEEESVAKHHDEEHFQLADLKKKEFESEDKLKYDSSPEEFEVEKVVHHKNPESDSDEIVLMDRNDFANLSYYASKEKVRHSDDISLNALLQRERKEQFTTIRPELIWVAAAAGLFLFYLVFCIVSYFSASFYTPTLLEKFPPQYEFTPSTSLQPRGELIRLVEEQGQTSRPVLFYIFKPAVRRFEISRFLSGQPESYDFNEITQREIRIGQSEWFDSLRVVMNYGRNVPSNLGSFLHLPLVELYVDGILKMYGQETFFSSLIPGYTNLTVYDEAGSSIGKAYISKGNWYISLDDESSYSTEQRELIERELLWIFSIVKI